MNEMKANQMKLKNEIEFEFGWVKWVDCLFFCIAPFIERAAQITG